MAAPVPMRIYSEVCGWYRTFLDSQISQEKNESVNAGWERTSEIRMTASLLPQHTSSFHILTPRQLLCYRCARKKAA